MDRIIDSKRLRIAELIMFCIFTCFSLASLALIVIAYSEKPLPELHATPFGAELLFVADMLIFIIMALVLPVYSFLSAKRLAGLTGGSKWFKYIHWWAFIYCIPVLIALACEEGLIFIFILGIFYFGIVSLLTLSRQADFFTSRESVKNSRLRAVEYVLCTADIILMLMMPVAFPFGYKVHLDVETILYDIVGPLSALAVIACSYRASVSFPRGSLVRKVLCLSVILFAVVLIVVAIVSYHPGIVLHTNSKIILGYGCVLCYCYAVFMACLMIFLLNNRLSVQCTSRCLDRCDREK